MNRVLILLALLPALPALAQQSASYKLEEYAFNSAGHPANGVVLHSASYTISRDSVGDALWTRSLQSDSFHLDAGLVFSFPLPGEVAPSCGAGSGSCVELSHIGGLTGMTTLTWPPETSVGTYNVYRDLMSNLAGLGFGVCSQQALTVETAMDSDPVPAHDGFFYLVTAENRLAEEGPKGLRSDGEARLGAVCP